jgi:hydrogenase-4 transcriptional activator
MDRAVLVGQGRTLNVVAALGQGGPLTGPSPSRSEDRATVESIEPLETVVRRHIERALHETGGRVEGPHGAARLLRINPHTLRARMRKLKIPWQTFRVHPTRQSGKARYTGDKPR